MNSPPFDRLTPVDLINLYVESPSAPTRVGAVAILDRHALVGPDGALRIDAIRETLDHRLRRVPRLRQVIHHGGPFTGRPIWADDPAFAIDRHVREHVLRPGDELNDLAMELVTQPFDRAHPLWRLWFVTGLPSGHVGLVFGMHHVVADGVTTVRLFGALTDAAPDGGAVSTPQPAPSWGALVRDNISGKLAAVGRLRRPDLAQWRAMGALRDAPRTSLNRPVGARRRLDAVTVDLAAAKRAAHQHGGKVNDVVLALAAGGLRALLASRSEPVDGVRLHVSVAVSLRGPQARPDVGNRSGGMAERVPLDGDPHARLRAIAQESAQVKGMQLPTVGNGLLVGLSQLGLLRSFSRHQKMINIVESNVAGPPVGMRLLGAPILDVTPIGTLVGNLSIGFLALSYAGRLKIAVQADADRYPDLPVLMGAMRRDSRMLLADAPPVGGAPTFAELLAGR